MLSARGVSFRVPAPERRCNPELPCSIREQRVRRRLVLDERGSGVTQHAELYREAEPIMCAAFLLDHCMIALAERVATNSLILGVGHREERGALDGGEKASARHVRPVPSSGTEFHG
jgi:hypothetical protein